MKFLGILQESRYFDYLPFEFLVPCTFWKICPQRQHKMQSNECQVNYLAYFNDEKYSIIILIYPSYENLEVFEILSPSYLCISRREIIFKNLLMLYYRINKCNNLLHNFLVKDSASLIVSKSAVKAGYFQTTCLAILV